MAMASSTMNEKRGETTESSPSPMTSTPNKKHKKCDNDPFDDLSRYLNLSRPSKECRQQIMQFIHDDGFGYLMHYDGDKKKVLLWLYLRVFYGDSAKRKPAIKAIIENDNAVKRLESLLNSTSDNYTENDETFYENWKKVVENWSRRDSCVTIFEGSKSPTVVLRKQQLMSNCFLHAPAVMHSYLLQRDLDGFEGVVDISIFVRRNLDDDALFRLAMVACGVSYDILDSLLDSATLASVWSTYKKFGNKIHQHFGTYGPGLVSNFTIEATMISVAEKNARKEFPEIPHFENYGSAAEGGMTHAMVVVGTSNTNGSHKFLLQNWWNGLQFLTVSEDFLKKSGCCVHFVADKVEKSQDFEMVPHRVAEAHIPKGLDMAPCVYDG